MRRATTALVILSVTACSLVKAQNDVITGTDVAEDFRGGDGDDTMLGNQGEDTLLGQSGEDILQGGPGDDRLGGGNGDDTIRGDAGDDVVASGAGADTMQGGPGADFLIGGPGDDLLLGGAANDTLLGGVGNDEMSGEGGRDLFFGGPGNDILGGQPDLDTCVLNPSDDDCVTVNFGDGCAVDACLPFAVPVLRGDPALDAVGPSLLLPSIEADRCTALAPGTLSRTFSTPNLPAEGNPVGVSVADFAGDFAGAVVTFSTTSCCPSTCEDIFTVNGNGDDIVFNIPLDGSGGNVYIFVTYPRTAKDFTFSIDLVAFPFSDGDATPPGRLRRRSLEETTKDGKKEKKEKKTKDDKKEKKTKGDKKEKQEKKKFVPHTKEQSALITQTCEALNAVCDPNLAMRFQSSLQLQKVNIKRAKTATKTPPVVRASPTLSPEVMAKVEIATGTDFEELEKNNNPVGVGPNGSIFIGGPGDDILRGRGGDDRMAGQEGDDTMIGALDDDVLLGGVDMDLLIAGGGSDIVQGNSGSDFALGGAGEDTMIGGPGDDELRGGAGADVLAGAIGNDTLRGNAGNDTFNAGAGDDIILGGADSDVMFGDEGIDQCLLQANDAYIVNFDETCTNELCAPFTQVLPNNADIIDGNVFVATQAAVRFECNNMMDDLTVEGAQVFAIDTTAFTPPASVILTVTDAQFEGVIALSDSCCAQTCTDVTPLVDGQAQLTTTFPLGVLNTVYAFVVSFNQTRGTFSVNAEEDS